MCVKIQYNVWAITVAGALRPELSLRHQSTWFLYHLHKDFLNTPFLSTQWQFESANSFLHYITTLYRGCRFCMHDSSQDKHTNMRRASSAEPLSLLFSTADANRDSCFSSPEWHCGSCFFSFLADKFCKANNNILPLDQLIANKYLNSHVVTPACIYLQNKQVFYVKTI